MSDVKQKKVHPFFERARKPATCSQETADSNAQCSFGLQSRARPPPLQHEQNVTVDAKDRAVSPVLARPCSPPNPLSPTRMEVRTSSRWNTEAFSAKPDLLWPPSRTVHVRDGDAETPRFLGGVELQPTYQLRKQKGKRQIPLVSSSESVLSKQSREPNQSLSERVICTSNASRPPGKEKRTRRSLRKLVQAKVQCTHPAIAEACAALDTDLCAFERGEYDNLPWTQKYAPSACANVLQRSDGPDILRAWLRSLMVSVDAGSSIPGDKKQKKKPLKDFSNASKKKKRRKRYPDDLSGFIVPSEEDEDEDMADAFITVSRNGSDECKEHENNNDPDDDDELANSVTTHGTKSVVRASNNGSDGHPHNVLLVSGPTGCGKTATVYAVAKELGFEVFEINPSSRRSAKDIVERVGDMTQNHLVRISEQSKDAVAPAAKSSSTDKEKTSSIQDFFNPKASITKAKTETKEEAKPLDGRAATHKQSLLLLEEVDILYDEDKTFWAGVQSLAKQSKRPVILTCTDENVVPLDDLHIYGIIRLKAPPRDLVTDYLYATAAREGHLLEQRSITQLYEALGFDLRATMMTLDYWCQMGVGSEKAGFDWYPDWRLFSQSPNEEKKAERLLSINTFADALGFYNRDTCLPAASHLDQKIRLQEDCMYHWDIGLMDWEETIANKRAEDASLSSENIASHSRLADTRSDFDIFCGPFADSSKNPLDLSLPRLSSQQRLNYTQAYPLLEADMRDDFWRLSASIGATFSVLLNDVDDKETTHNMTSDAAEVTSQIHARMGNGNAHPALRTKLAAPFQPLSENPDFFSMVPGRQTFSLDRERDIIAQDIAPYVRSIVKHDQILEQKRLELSNLLSQGGKKVGRTTRASRAAMGGSTKASVRKERWFSNKLVPSAVLRTAGPSWQEILSKNMEQARRPQRWAGGGGDSDVDLGGDGDVDVDDRSDDNNDEHNEDDDEEL